MAEITDPETRKMGVDELLMQMLGMFRSSRKAVDELLTARFHQFDTNNDEDLSFDEFGELITSVDVVSVSLRYVTVACCFCHLSGAVADNYVRTLRRTGLSRTHRWCACIAASSTTTPTRMTITWADAR